MMAVPFFSGMSLAQTSYREVEVEVVSPHRGSTPITTVSAAPPAPGSLLGSVHTPLYCAQQQAWVVGPVIIPLCGCTN